MPEALGAAELPHSIDPTEAAYAVDVTIANAGEETVDVGFSPDSVAPDAASPPSELSGTDFDTHLNGHLAPGETMTGRFGWVVSADTPAVNVEYTAYAVTIWNVAFL